MLGQQHSFDSLQAGIDFPGPSVTLSSFSKLESLPLIHLPKTFLLTAKGMLPSGKLSMKLLFSTPSISSIMHASDVTDNVTVEVVFVVMNNMENFLPKDVIQQSEEK